MKIGAIIRSVGERTERLCYESVAQYMPEKNIHIVKNMYPFAKAVGRMIDIAIEEKFTWFLGLDADVVLKPGWMSIANGYVLQEDIEQYYMLDFLLVDRFVKKRIPGVHFYNGLFNMQMKEALAKVKDTNKPEGNIRHKIGAPRFQTPEYIGYHGFQQYYRDIYNRFVIRAGRNPEYIKKHSLFQGILDQEEMVGLAGWQYGCMYRDKIIRMLDARNKIDINVKRFEEIGEMDMSLEDFYIYVSSFVSKRINIASI